MKNILLFLFSILLTLSSCSKEDVKVSTCENCNFTCLSQNVPNVHTNDCQDNWDCSFKIFSQSSIDLDENQGVTNGNKNVFQMVLSTEGNDAIADDEFTNILVFDLDEWQNSFSVEDSELANMGAHYRRICYCNEVDFQPITIGCLQGEKQVDGSWFVQGYVEGAYESGGKFEFGIDAQFTN